MLWADSDYFGEGKIKCAISKADAGRQVASRRKMPQTNATLFPYLLVPIPQGKRPE